MTAGYIGMQLPAAPEQPLYIPPGTTFPLAANTRFPYGISHESESVSRKFRLALTGTTVAAGGAPTWSNNDPYEYAWYSLQNPGNTANPGVLIFNPSGHNQPSVNTAGSHPLTAESPTTGFSTAILFVTLKSVPASAPYTIALSLPFLKLGGLVLDNQNVLNNFNAALNPYNGIYRDPNNTTPDIIIYNVNTGQEVGDWTNQNAPSGTGVLTIDKTVRTWDTTQLMLIQKTGIITLNASVVASMNLASASLRIFYRTQKRLGNADSEGNRPHYKEASSPCKRRFQQPHYVGDGTTGSATRVYFAPCDGRQIGYLLGEFLR